jgi:signal transduction histidine kinase/ligand-binding sensor domain-containing protein/DNA-binding response OmpR family regulator
VCPFCQIATNQLHMIRFVVCLCCCFLFIAPVFSQAPAINFKHIQNEDGLSNSTIECIYQDGRGFVWFGTRDGLNRYDGYKIKVFKTNDSIATSISDNFITCLFQDKSQQLWIGTANGLNSFDPVTNSFTRYKYTGKPGSISYNYISSIVEENNNRLLISTLGGGLNIFDKTTRSFTSLRQNGTAKGPASDKIYCLYKDSRGNTWVGSDAGIQIFDAENAFFKTPAAISNVNNAVTAIKEDKGGNLIIGTAGNGLYLFNQQFNTLKQFSHSATDNASISSNLVRAIWVTASGKIWTGTVNGGLDLFDPVSGRFFNYKYEPGDPQSLSQRTVSALYEDNQENLWVGTHRGGVNIYMPKTEKFSLYRQERSDNSLSYNDVKSFCEDREGNIWIGTDGGGLNLFDKNKQTFSHPVSAHIIGPEVLGITEDSNGKLWIATWGGGLCNLDYKSRAISRFTNNPADSTSISSNFIQSIFEDSRKRLWIATYYGGLNLFDQRTKKFSLVKTSSSGKTKISGSHVVSINEDKSGNIWIGTDDGGLNCLHQSTGEFVHYFNDDEKKPDLRIIFIDSHNRLWIGQRGLYLFNEKQNTFELFTKKAGLSDEFIKGIVEDNNGIFWITTSNGLTRFNPSTLEFKKYNTADGLQGMEFEANAFLKTRDGQIFFGGVNGFNSFYPKNIFTNNFIPPVYITDLQISNDPNASAKQKEDISYTHKVVLSYKQSTFAFSFAALNFVASENNKFAYKLDGWDKVWLEAGNDRKASYTNVSPGTYTFRVKASNNDGIWNETGQTITIVITPPFWATWWFKTIVALIVGAVAYNIYQNKRKLERQKLEEEKKEEVHQMQLQFFTNISHEFRTPLSLIMGPAEKLMAEKSTSQNNQYHKVIYRNAHRLMNLINELMDFRKAESGILKLHAMPGNMELFLQEIAEEFSEAASEKNIHFSVSTSGIPAETWFDRQILEKILINLIGNSFKYTASGGTITVQALASMEGYKPSFENNLNIASDYKPLQTIYLRVTDNGIGISKESIVHLFERYYKVSDSHMGYGIGLAFVKSITALHKGSIRVFSERNKGTEIIVALPCSREDFDDHERWMNNQPANSTFAGAYNREEKPEDMPVEEEPLPENEEAPLILIVDDNDELRNFLKDSIGKKYRIAEAANGRDGLELAKSTHPDLIISDIMMPVMNGVDLCRQVKDDVEISDIPFLMLTAKESLQSKIEGTDSGADHYFTKPISINLLEKTIDNIFKQKEKLKEKYRRDHYSEVKDIVQNSKDKDFLQELINVIETHISSPEMDINYICTQIGMSRTSLYHKIKSITGQSIGEFIRSIRLKKAAQLLTEEDISITEAMYNVGIQTQSYFTKAFKAEFGKTPSQFLKELKR